MTIKEGKEGTMTDRDWRIVEDLYLARYLTTKQLAWMHFGSYGRARTRLPQLRKKGWVVPHPTNLEVAGMNGGTNVWRLTRDAFEIARESIEAEDSTERFSPKQLSPQKMAHYIQTNEVYVEARDRLRRIMGDYPEGWVWRHEARASTSYDFRGEPRVHRPDAEILFSGHVFILERQTAASRISPKDMADKMATYRSYITGALGGVNAADLLFACEGKREAEMASRQGKQYGIYVVGGTPKEIAAYLCESAEKMEG